MRIRYLPLLAIVLLICLALLSWRQLGNHDSTQRISYWLGTSQANANQSAARVPESPQFHCGQSVCDRRTSYCELIKTDVAAIPDIYACKPLPATCRPNASGELPSCDCFPPRTHCAYCSKISPQGVEYLHRTCVGGGAGNQHGAVEGVLGTTR